MSNIYPTWELKRIGETIVEQMGGMNTLVWLAGAKNFIAREIDNCPTLDFSFGGSERFDHCRVTLTPADDYTVLFYKSDIVNGVEVGPISEMASDYFGMYCDQLIGLFEDVTGLYLSFQ